MLPSRIFRSRWAALLWAAGILWTAYDVASAYGGPDRGGAPATGDAMGQSVNAADLSILANAGG